MNLRLVIVIVNYRVVTSYPRSWNAWLVTDVTQETKGINSGGDTISNRTGREGNKKEPCNSVSD